ncbi:MAG: phosphoenolpyruvate--protein phosphotransferase [Zetaproteobacteria bacterium]|nr:MAG: phosphoenolpyruvate--protein phosphotransferase [Zetaproteobacteria bacterium]
MNAARQPMRAVAKSAGIAIGRVQQLAHGRVPIPELKIAPHQAEDEVARFRDGVKRSLNEINEECAQLEKLEVLDPLLILEAHRMILNDPELLESTMESIRRDLINAEWALRQQVDRIKAVFAAIEDPYLRERGEDIEQVGSRIIRHLQGSTEDTGGQAGFAEHILIADDFSPVDVVKFWRLGAAGLIAEQGGMNAHNIIVARGIGLPMLVGANGILGQAKDGDQIILDAELGTWTINPSARELEQYALFRHALAVVERDLCAYATRPSLSADGRAMALLANLEFVDEVALLTKVGAEGIGLFRSEYMFMSASGLPDARQQAAAYSRLVQAVGDGPVTVRLLDIGGDKPALFREIARRDYLGTNPALGLRGIRLLRRWPAVIEQQLLGILLAAQEAPIQILVPMVAAPEEMLWVRALCEKICRREGLRENVRIGAMIEVPAAVIIADELAKVSDFFSIGTNDLIQYALAMDRGDEEGESLYDARHPAIERMITLTADSAKRHGIALSVCGELAADDNWTQFFLDLGVDALSMSTHYILPIRKHLAKLQYQGKEKAER